MDREAAMRDYGNALLMAVIQRRSELFETAPPPRSPEKPAGKKAAALGK
jgi:hypothetical protein